MIKCSKCGKPAVIEMEHGFLCESCFLNYFEHKIYKTIVKYKLIKEKDKVGVAVSGGKDSISVLHNVLKFLKKYGRKPIAIAIDEGIKGYRENTLKTLKKYCKMQNVMLHLFSFKEEYGKTLDQIVKDIEKKRLRINACHVCGILRRQLLNKAAKELSVDVLITGHNLDDESQTILMNLFKGNKDMLPRQGLKTEIMADFFVPRAKPLYFLKDKEVKLYTILKKFGVTYNECPYSIHSFRNDVEEFLNSFEDKYKGTKHSIVNTYLHFLPKIKEKLKGKPKTCKYCGQPANQNVCKACKLLIQIYGENYVKRIHESE